MASPKRSVERGARPYLPKRPGPRPPRANDNGRLAPAELLREVQPQDFGRAVRLAGRVGLRASPIGRLLNVIDAAELLYDALQPVAGDSYVTASPPIVQPGLDPTADQMVEAGWLPNGYWGAYVYDASPPAGATTVVGPTVRTYAGFADYNGYFATVADMDEWHTVSMSDDIIPDDDYSAVGVGQYVTLGMQTVDSVDPGLVYFTDYWQATRLEGAVNPYAAGPPVVRGVVNEVDPNVLRGLPSPRPFEPPVLDDQAVVERFQDRAVEVYPSDRPVARVGRAPPGRRDREKKFVSATAQIAAAIFRALDVISEGAEIVDALYQALPKHIRDRWERKYSDRRGLIDAAGQYGIAGADWKARALWYNVIKIDGDQAFKNLINNAVQDELLGQLHKRLPVNTGAALDEAFREVDKLIREYANV